MIELTPPPIKIHRPQRRWTQEEIDFLKKNYQSLKGSAKLIGNKLDRGWSSIQKKARSLGLTNQKYTNRGYGRFWGVGDTQYLKDNYGKVSTGEIAEKLNRTKESVVSQAFNLGFAPKRLGRMSKKAGKLKWKYGLSEYDYYKRVELLDNKCEVCGEHETKIHNGTKRVQELAVDHDHTTNKNRGLLCHRCNLIVIGALRSPEILNSAIHYLEKDGVL